jgi:peroxin-5
MRKLRDGEVAVEGDKVVEQIGSSGELSWADQMAREEEGRSNAAHRIDPGVSRGAELEGFAQKQHSFAEQQARHAALARTLGRDYNDMASLWEDEDQAREARERSRAKGKAKQQFQGDGGMVVDDDGVDDGSFLLRDEKTREQIMRDTTVPLSSQYWEEEDFDPSMIVGGHAMQQPVSSSKHRAKTAQQKEWEKLQDDWEEFEATATGIQSTSTANSYAFTPNNPYIQSTRTHAMHTSNHQTTFDSVLEHEAAVQRDPENSQRWLALGIKQQENEREELAIKALRRALELEPQLGEAYLALAVSYTNENERSLAYEAVDKWVDSLARGQYRREIDNYRDMFGPLPSDGHGKRHEYLTALLIQLAQSREQVDPDVQIGLGVLFNTSEEYTKASDCFGAALSVRPDVRSIHLD